jgi:hypothetical protein
MKKLKNGRVLPPQTKRRADLVVTSACAACGRGQGTYDLNDHPAFSEHVRRGEDLPDAARAEVRKHFARAGLIETCACGARTVFAASADGDMYTGLKGAERTPPVIDGLKVARGELVLEGRFLHGVSVEEHQRGPRQVRAASSRRRDVSHRGEKITEAEHFEVVLDGELPARGHAVVLSVTNGHGTTTQSVIVT